MNKKLKAALITIALILLVLLFVFLVILYTKVVVWVIIGIGGIVAIVNLYETICEELDDN
jgi:hypothetical protein